MKKLLLLLLLVSTVGISQTVNDYNYVIIPSKFTFQKETNQYGLSTLSKLFMEKNGFTVFFDNEVLPDYAAKEQCKLFLDVEKNSNMFSTKLTVILKDCKNNVVFTSAEGKSLDKDYKVAYNQALREAFRSFDNLNYKYNGGQNTNQETVSTSGNPVKESVSVPVSTVNLLTAQPIENGFQLIDTTPKIVLKIYKTSQVDVFLADQDGQKGVLVKNKGQWIFEYYDKNNLVSKSLNIKF